MEPVFQAQADSELVDDLQAARFGPWRPFSTRGAAVHEWTPGRPTRPTVRSAISVTTAKGTNLGLVRRIWSYYEAAAEHFGVGLDPPILEYEAVSRIRTGCRLDTHRDYQTAVLSMSIALTNPGSYDGGEFYIHPSGEPEHCYKPEHGTVLVFPSQWRHGVTMVTRGQRDTYVSKALGPQGNPEVDTVRVDTGRISPGQSPDRRELGRRIRLQQAHNRAASDAHHRNDPAGMQAAIAHLWSTR